MRDLLELRSAVEMLLHDAKRVERSEAETSHLHWLWRGKAIAYATIVARIDIVLGER